MNILISNDDGINAKGIHVLADALSQMDDVRIFVVAPDRQRSCCGHGLTMSNTLHVKKHDISEFGGKVVLALDCDGFPSDCIRLGLHILREQGTPADLVCSGINLGSNYGTDAYYSGTIAAAREGTVCFTQAIAFSLCSHDCTHFEHFRELVPEVVSKTYGNMNKHTVLNVNVPDIAEIKGIKICRQGPMDYALDYIKQEEGSYILNPDLIVGQGYDMTQDGFAGREGYITMTALQLMPYSEAEEKKLEELDIRFNGQKALSVFDK